MKNNETDFRGYHDSYNKFSNWMIKTFGKDLQGLTFYEMCKVKHFIKGFCPEITIINCDDSNYTGSYLILIPHPTHGITVFFIPQRSKVQNQFFLYKSHHKELIKALKEMGTVYGKG